MLSRKLSFSCHFTEVLKKFFGHTMLLAGYHFLDQGLNLGLLGKRAES